LKSVQDEPLISSILYLSRTNPDELIDRFIHDYIDIEEPTANRSVISTTVSWRNMQYLWKQYLDMKNLPSAITLQVVKGKVITKLANKYKEDADEFQGICSKYLPEIQKFILYWNSTIVQDETETDMEMEEIIILFKKWTQTNNEYPSTLAEKQMIDLISYYYPNIEIENNKYISHIRSTLWDKKFDIEASLQKMRTDSIFMNTDIPIHDLYVFYCKCENTMNVSKAYFEKYIQSRFSGFLLDPKVLSKEWIESLSV
jgi:hypothetical protein